MSNTRVFLVEKEINKNFIEYVSETLTGVVKFIKGNRDYNGNWNVSLMNVDQSGIVPISFILNHKGEEVIEMGAPADFDAEKYVAKEGSGLEELVEQPKEEEISPEKEEPMEE